MSVACAQHVRSVGRQPRLETAGWLAHDDARCWLAKRKKQKEKKEEEEQRIELKGKERKGQIFFWGVFFSLECTTQNEKN